MRIETETVNGLSALRLTAYDRVAVALLGLGAKICSLRWRGHELLAQNPHKTLRAARRSGVAQPTAGAPA